MQCLIQRRPLNYIQWNRKKTVRQNYQQVGHYVSCSHGLVGNGQKQIKMLAYHRNISWLCIMQIAMLENK